MTSETAEPTHDDYVRRLHALDWRDLPEGHYAVPVYEFTDNEFTDGEDAEPPLLGHRTFRRTITRTDRHGRQRGRDSFVRGAVYAAPGIGLDRLAQEVREQREALIDIFGPRGDDLEALADLLRDANGRDTYRPLFGQITGKCGYCGKTLTDPTSKLIGIGPDCRGERRPRRTEENVARSPAIPTHTPNPAHLF